MTIGAERQGVAKYARARGAPKGLNKEKIRHYVRVYRPRTACGRLVTETSMTVKFITSDRVRVTCLSCLRAMRSPASGDANG